MALVNYATREINAKIVYYGPGLSGKTTNIHHVFERIRPDNKGKLISLSTQGDRTLFFDFLPVELGNIKGFKTRFHLYTVPGQVFYNSTRKLVLKGADGVVFVADSQKMMMDENIQSLENLKLNLADMGLDIKTFPVVLQYNKRDLPNAATVEEINEYLNPYGFPYFEASAYKGEGVLKTLTAIVKFTLNDLKDAPSGHSVDFESLDAKGDAPPVEAATAESPALPEPDEESKAEPVSDFSPSVAALQEMARPNDTAKFSIMGGDRTGPAMPATPLDNTGPAVQSASVAAAVEHLPESEPGATVLAPALATHVSDLAPDVTSDLSGVEPVSHATDDILAGPLSLGPEVMSDLPAASGMDGMEIPEAPLDLFEADDGAGYADAEMTDEYVAGHDGEAHIEAEVYDAVELADEHAYEVSDAMHAGAPEVASEEPDDDAWGGPPEYNPTDFSPPEFSPPEFSPDAMPVNMLPDEEKIFSRLARDVYPDDSGADSIPVMRAAIPTGKDARPSVYPPHDDFLPENDVILTELAKDEYPVPPEEGHPSRYDGDIMSAIELLPQARQTFVLPVRITMNGGMTRELTLKMHVDIELEGEGMDGVCKVELLQPVPKTVQFMPSSEHDDLRLELTDIERPKVEGVLHKIMGKR